MAGKKGAKPVVEELVPVPLSDGGLVETPELIKLIHGFAKADATVEEIAAYFRVRPDEFRAFLINNPNSFKAFACGPAAGLAELKAAQHLHAKAGDSRLLVHLGKCRLGQVEGPPSGEVPGDAGSKDWDEMATWRMPRH